MNLDENRREILPPNPAAQLISSRIMHRSKRKKTIIKSDDMAAFYSALNDLVLHYSAGDALQYHCIIKTMLFTGQRSSEILRLCRSQADYVAARKKGLNAKGYYDDKLQLFYFHDQKNHEETEIPLSSEVIDIIGRSKPSGVWLLGSVRTGEQIGYNRVWAAVSWISKRSGVKCSPHDLRRTFVTVAEAIGISHYTYKALINHKVTNVDVTGGYISSELDVKRQASQRVCDAILAHARLELL